MTRREPQAVAESLDELGRGIRVEFYQEEDRFSHAIFGVIKGQPTLLLQSIEGTDSETAPPSPPFAELHQQPSLSFLTGATTLAHWSMSLQVVERGFWFDVACRSKNAMPWLGSKYRIAGNAFELELGDKTLSEEEGKFLQVIPSTDELVSFPTTIQWRYGIVCKG